MFRKIVDPSGSVSSIEKWFSRPTNFPLTVKTLEAWRKSDSGQQMTTEFCKPLGEEYFKDYEASIRAFVASQWRALHGSDRKGDREAEVANHTVLYQVCEQVQLDQEYAEDDARRRIQDALVRSLLYYSTYILDDELVEVVRTRSRMADPELARVGPFHTYTSGNNRVVQYPPEKCITWADVKNFVLEELQPDAFVVRDLEDLLTRKRKDKQSIVTWFRALADLKTRLEKLDVELSDAGWDRILTRQMTWQERSLAGNTFQAVEAKVAGDLKDKSSRDLPVFRAHAVQSITKQFLCRPKAAEEPPSSKRAQKKKSDGRAGHQGVSSGRPSASKSKTVDFRAGKKVGAHSSKGVSTGHSSTSAGGDRKKKDSDTRVCYGCGKPGHIKSNCPTNPYPSRASAGARAEQFAGESAIGEGESRSSTAAAGAEAHWATYVTENFESAPEVWAMSSKDMSLPAISGTLTKALAWIRPAEGGPPRLVTVALDSCSNVNLVASDFGWEAKEVSPAVVKTMSDAYADLGSQQAEVRIVAPRKVTFSAVVRQTEGLPTGCVVLLSRATIKAIGVDLNQHIASQCPLELRFLKSEH